MRIKLNTECIRYIALFESLTGATVNDCLIDPDSNKVTFIVKEGQAGLAIGKNGANIQNIEGVINRKVEVLEFSSDPLKFLSNIFRPIPIETYISEKSDGSKTVHLQAPKNRVLVRAKLKRAKSILQKYFKINDIVFT